MKTSKEWVELLIPQGEYILDPDGWDRSNYQHSFNEEKITKDEFFKRLVMSTVAITMATYNKIKEYNE